MFSCYFHLSVTGALIIEQQRGGEWQEKTKEEVNKLSKTVETVVNRNLAQRGGRLLHTERAGTHTQRAEHSVRGNAKMDTWAHEYSSGSQEECKNQQCTELLLQTLVNGHMQTASRGTCVFWHSHLDDALDIKTTCTTLLWWWSLCNENTLVSFCLCIIGNRESSNSMRCLFFCVPLMIDVCTLTCKSAASI